MKITEIRLGLISVPLRVPFKTALRSVDSVEDVIVEIHTDNGAVGYGEAPPTGVITGDTTGAIIGAIQDHMEHTINNLDNVVENTTSAESQIRDTDMAEEMVEYSKNNILAQAGQSMLAQANQATQGVMSLLQ